jgi:hypothetical protein
MPWAAHFGLALNRAGRWFDRSNGWNPEEIRHPGAHRQN